MRIEHFKSPEEVAHYVNEKFNRDILCSGICFHIMLLCLIWESVAGNDSTDHVQTDTSPVRNTCENHSAKMTI